MTTKTLTITEDAYQLLKQHKGEKESFSAVIRKLVSRKGGDIWQYFGAWKDMPEAEFQQIKQAIAENRARTNARRRELFQP